MGAGWAGAVVEIARCAVGMMVIIVGAGMIVRVRMVVTMASRPGAFDDSALPGASANRTHQATSRSLIFNSSPPVGEILPPPQVGQLESRSSSGTVFSQSKQ